MTVRLLGPLLVLADLAALDLFRPDAARFAAHAGALTDWFAVAGADRAVATSSGAALWLAACWVALGLLAAAAGRLPGAAGATGRRLAGALLPRVLHRLVAGSAGLGVLLAPVAALAAIPDASPPAPGSAVSAPAWPVDPPAHPAPSRSAPSPKHEAPAPRVTVRPGDSLWLIAARRLGPSATPGEIAAEWPRWYAANEHVIGADPDLIRPGQVLHAPADGGSS